jgi:NAD(P)H dehydrogenase (quinone)
MKVFIVFAHPEPHRSFGRALLDRSVETLQGSGHEVRVSDLYAMRFNPVASAEDFSSRRFPEALVYDREQKHAVQHDAVATDVEAELKKVLWCDLLILQVPLWWFSVPAMLKGWIDRVFMYGAVYGGGRRFDAGRLRGRRAMISTSTGAYPEMLGVGGLVGHVDVVLWPLQNGTLAYTGFDVLPPFIAHSVPWIDDAGRADLLDTYEQRLNGIETDDPIDFHPLADFGQDWRLRPEVTPRAVGQGAIPREGARMPELLKEHK